MKKNLQRTRIINKLSSILLVVLLILFFSLLLHIGFRKHEKVECLQWKILEANYPLFYTNEWQREQCNPFQIEFKK